MDADGRKIKKREEPRLKVQLIQSCYMTRRFQADVEVET